MKRRTSAALVLRAQPEVQVVAPAPVPDQLHPGFPMKLRQKLECRARRRARIAQFAPVFGFVAVVVIVVALLVSP
jgi:hypothetical protein